jgi:type III secretory pathway component EscR
MKNESVGMGTAVPPTKNHVLIYFLQKGAQEENALNFYAHFQKKKWKNNKNTKLNNWKIAAWNWILNA